MNSSREYVTALLESIDGCLAEEGAELTSRQAKAVIRVFGTHLFAAMAYIHAIANKTGVDLDEAFTIHEPVEN